MFFRAALQIIQFPAKIQVIFIPFFIENPLFQSFQDCAARLTGYCNATALRSAVHAQYDQAPGIGAPFTAASGTNAPRDCAEIHR